MKLNELLKSSNEFIFLDSNLKNTKSYFFANPIKKIEVFDFNALEKALKEIENYSKKYWLAGYIRYEAGHKFLNNKFYDFEKTDKPLLWFGVYDEPQIFEKINTGFFYKPLIKIANSLNFEQFEQKISQIKQEIRAGNTYQVNFTFDNILEIYSSIENLYFYLRARQKTDYSAIIKNKYDTILSFSPELFFKIENDKIIAKPMKGTFAGKDFCEENAKICAENLMIVDLLRNDLGKIADKKSVKVESLMDIEEYETLKQMTSTISADISVGYFDVFKALFPCGSVTGAPKIETMRIINDLEENNRDVYCGAIGYISPEKRAVFSVPIRILQKIDEQNWRFRVGSGIVWDSDAREEWNENQLKTKFLETNFDDLELIETMLLQKNKIIYLKEHLQRLKNSAEFFGFVYDEELVLQTIKKIEDDNKIIRLILKKNGEIFCEILDIVDNRSRSCKFSEIVLDKKNIFLKHKTNYRPWYKMNKNTGIFDEIFMNQDGEVCEGARTNIFIEKHKKLYTPKLSAGLLNGIMRQDLLNQKKVEEKILFKEDILKADRIFLGNSVRGLVEVKLESF